jgi:arginine:pyruvate transaminase
MKYASVTDRLATLGGQKWEVHELARKMVAEGRDIIELTIGEPDVPTPPFLVKEACSSMQKGRTRYSEGRGEKPLRQALAQRYSQRLDQPISDQQILCFPGTQTALYAVMRGIVESGDEVLVGDPMYATYEGVIASSGAVTVPIPLRPECGFRLQAKDLATKINKNTQAILLNTPHNPTGAVSTPEEIQQIGELAKKHDLWLIVDEVYEELVFNTVSFCSPLSFNDFADRVIVVSSISKSWAAPGFRSGWCVAPEDFCDHVLPLAETMLFGNQPFIADMTTLAVSRWSELAQDMAKRFEKRADLLMKRLHENTGLKVHKPQAGMFALVDVSATGLTGYDYAIDLLTTNGVAVMPGNAFGASLENWVRVALTIDDALLLKGCDRIIAHEKSRKEVIV